MTPQKAGAACFAPCLFLLFHLAGLKAVHQQHILRSGEGETICPLSPRKWGCGGPRWLHSATRHCVSAIDGCLLSQLEARWGETTHPPSPSEHWRGRATKTTLSNTHHCVYTTEEMSSLTARGQMSWPPTSWGTLGLENRQKPRGYHPQIRVRLWGKLDLQKGSVSAGNELKW